MSLSPVKAGCATPTLDFSSRIRPKWRPAVFVLLHVMAGLLLASWLWPVSRAFWDSIDLHLFRYLNDTLRDRPVWSAIWAVGNVRSFDAIIGLVLVLFLLNRNLVFSAKEIRVALFTVVALMLIILFIRSPFTYLAGQLGWQRGSPTAVLDDTIRLGQEFPWLKEKLKLKDKASGSFPGDHAAVLLIWGAFVVMFARGWKLAFGVALTILFCLPRLIAGAHWFTDIAVGSTFVVLVGMAWGYCTPLAAWIAQAGHFFAHPILNHLRRLPGLRDI